MEAQNLRTLQTRVNNIGTEQVLEGKVKQVFAIYR